MEETWVKISQFKNKMLVIFPILITVVLSSQPHIIFVLVDDVGVGDFSYGNSEAVIQTPNIDFISGQGIRLTNYYAHPTCTPSRAALMTGRYAINTGLTWPMVVGAPVGLPDSLPTLPQLLRKMDWDPFSEDQGYSTHMVGKWHLGSAKWKHTPVGKGFQSFTGSLNWDVDYWTKQIWKMPDQAPLGIDWMTAYENGSFIHRIDNRHVSDLITEEAQGVIKRQRNLIISRGTKQPLFLYVAYTAAHSPLQPKTEHEEMCQHIPHLWRRQYCGLVKGLDEGIGKIYRTARENLGDNLIFVVSSDNGGSPWFGGLNTLSSSHSLRGTKVTPFEGGVRVPGFIVDLSGQYLGFGGRTYDGLVHITDWLPTLLSIAGSQFDLSKLDGEDISWALRENRPSPRTEMLLDLYLPEQNIYGEEVAAIRWGKWKLLRGDLRDPNFYHESREDYLNITLTSILSENGNVALSWIAPICEVLIRGLDWIFGVGPMDSMRITVGHRFCHEFYTLRNQTRLYNLESDPQELHDLSEEEPAIVNYLQSRIDHYIQHRAPTLKWWMQLDPDTDWRRTLVPGNCFHHLLNAGDIKFENCLFIHPFLPDDVDPQTLPLINANDLIPREIKRISLLFLVVIIALLLSLC